MESLNADQESVPVREVSLHNNGNGILGVVIEMVKGYQVSLLNGKGDIREVSLLSRGTPESCLY